MNHANMYAVGLALCTFADIASEEMSRDLANEIEKLTRHELKVALTAPFRPRNYDSTAGPPLTLTATIPTELRSLQRTREKSPVQDDRFSED